MPPYENSIRPFAQKVIMPLVKNFLVPAAALIMRTASTLVSPVALGGWAIGAFVGDLYNVLDQEYGAYEPTEISSSESIWDDLAFQWELATLASDIAMYEAFGKLFGRDDGGYGSDG